METAVLHQPGSASQGVGFSKVPPKCHNWIQHSFLCLSHTKQHLLELPVLTQPLAARLLDKSILARFWSRRTSQRKRLERIGPDMVTELDRSNTVWAKSHECWYFREKRINVQKMFRKYYPFTRDGKRHAHCILPIGYVTLVFRYDYIQGFAMICDFNMIFSISVLFDYDSRLQWFMNLFCSVRSSRPSHEMMSVCLLYMGLTMIYCFV